MEKTFDTEMYVICHNGADIIHPSKVQAGTTLASGQPQYEEFSSEDDWKTRLTELGYDVSQLDGPQLSRSEKVHNPGETLLKLRSANEE